MKPRYKKLLSMLFTAAMVFNIGLPIFTEGTAPPGISGYVPITGNTPLPNRARQ